MVSQPRQRVSLQFFATLLLVAAVAFPSHVLADDADDADDVCASVGGCAREPGFCVHADNHDINNDVTKNPNVDLPEAECLAWCKSTEGATGCERIVNQGNKGCYVFTTEDIHHGNGVVNHWCWVFHIDNGVGTCDVPAELAATSWRDVDGDFYQGMTVRIQNKLGLGGWTVQGSSTYGKSKLVLGCGRTGLNNDGVTYLLNLQEVTANGEASENAKPPVHRLPQNVP